MKIMSQRFNLNFDEMRRKNAEPIEDQDRTLTGTNQGEHYPSYGNVRNICFVWPEGKKLFLNYSYLISGACDTQFGEVVLTFSTHIITIKGYNLQTLFFEIMDQHIRLLLCIEERYNSLQPDGEPVVNNIVVAQN